MRALKAGCFWHVRCKIQSKEGHATHCNAWIMNIAHLSMQKTFGIHMYTGSIKKQRCMGWLWCGMMARGSSLLLSKNILRWTSCRFFNATGTYNGGSLMTRLLSHRTLADCWEHLDAMLQTLQSRSDALTTFVAYLAAEVSLGRYTLEVYLLQMPLSHAKYANVLSISHHFASPRITSHKDWGHLANANAKDGMRVLC